jgi:hypothetical protein
LFNHQSLCPQPFPQSDLFPISEFGFNGRVTRLFLRELLHRLKLPPVDLVPTDSTGEKEYFAALHAGDLSYWKPLIKIWEQRFEQYTDVPPTS